MIVAGIRVSYEPREGEQKFVVIPCESKTCDRGVVHRFGKNQFVVIYRVLEPYEARGPNYSVSSFTEQWKARVFHARREEFGKAITLSDATTDGMSQYRIATSASGAILAVEGATNEGSQMEPKWRSWINIFAFSARGTLLVRDTHTAPGSLIRIRMLGSLSARIYFLTADNSGNYLIAPYFWLNKRLAPEKLTILASREVAELGTEDYDAFAWYENRAGSCILRAEVFENTAKLRRMDYLWEKVSDAVCPMDKSPKFGLLEVKAPAPRRSWWQFWCREPQGKSYVFGPEFLLTPIGGYPYKKSYYVVGGRLQTPEGRPAPKGSESPFITAQKPAPPAEIRFSNFKMVLQGETLYRLSYSYDGGIVMCERIPESEGESVPSGSGKTVGGVSTHREPEAWTCVDGQPIVFVSDSEGNLFSVDCHNQKNLLGVWSRFWDHHILALPGGKVLFLALVGVSRHPVTQQPADSVYYAAVAPDSCGRFGEIQPLPSEWTPRYLFQTKDGIYGVKQEGERLRIGIFSEGFGFKPFEELQWDYDASVVLPNLQWGTANIFRPDGLWVVTMVRGVGPSLVQYGTGGVWKKIAVAESGHSPYALAEWQGNFFVAYTRYYKRSLHIVRVNAATREVAPELDITDMPERPEQVFLFLRGSDLWLAYRTGGTIHQKEIR